MISAIQFPQAFSRDMYIRMTQDQLRTLQLGHLYSDVTPESSDSMRKGISEWSGILCSQVVSMAWDWNLLDDGAVVIPRDAVLSTNIMVLDDAGYDISLAHRDALCLCKVATINWRRYIPV